MTIKYIFSISSNLYFILGCGKNLHENILFVSVIHNFIHNQHNFSFNSNNKKEK